MRVRLSMNLGPAGRGSCRAAIPSTMARLARRLALPGSWSLRMALRPIRRSINHRLVVGRGCRLRDQRDCDDLEGERHHHRESSARSAKSAVNDERHVESRTARISRIESCISYAFARRLLG